MYEYKVIDSPRRAQRFRDLAKGEDAFLRTLDEFLTALAHEGWEFLRSERLPCERGRLRRRSSIRDVLVFRREIKPLLLNNIGPEPEPELPSDPVRPRRIRDHDAVARVLRGDRRLVAM